MKETIGMRGFAVLLAMLLVSGAMVPAVAAQGVATELSSECETGCERSVKMSGISLPIVEPKVFSIDSMKYDNPMTNEDFQEANAGYIGYAALYPILDPTVLRPVALPGEIAYIVPLIAGGLGLAFVGCGSFFSRYGLALSGSCFAYGILICTVRAPNVIPYRIVSSPVTAPSSGRYRISSRRAQAWFPTM